MATKSQRWPISLVLVGGLALSAWLDPRLSAVRVAAAPPVSMSAGPADRMREDPEARDPRTLIGPQGPPGEFDASNPPPPRLAQGSVVGTMDPIILGRMDRDAIDAVIQRNVNKIRYCYDRERMKDNALSGKIVIKFTIAKDGTVSWATTKSSTMNSRAVESCVEEGFRQMQFPEPKGGGIVIVGYPLLFSPG